MTKDRSVYIWQRKRSVLLGVVEFKLPADECCDVPLIESLRSGGHDVVYAKEQMKGEEDDVVLEGAFRENRVLMTEDKDFGELVYRLKKPANGVILMRIPVETRQSKCPRLWFTR